jgi:drug/metabolite transporter (DMT)-like permease
MLFLALAVACSTAIAVVFKLTEGRMDRIALLTVNYGVALGVAAVRAGGEPMQAEAGMLGLGVVLGALFIAGFALFSKAIGVAGISLATGTMRLSVALPFVASWLVWGEQPTVGQWSGLAVAAVALALIARQEEPVAPPVLEERPVEPWRVAAVLAALFLAGGLVDTSFKVFEEEFAAQNSRPLFLLVVFAVAFAIGAVAVGARRLRTGRWPQAAVIWWGIGLGVINYGSAEFILLTLSELPGTFVFPAVNVSVVALATVLGVAVWRERLSAANGLGLALAAVALVLLAR